jgi:tRNA dimethylallyltransferase
MKVAILSGPTAAGKTRLALDLAKGHPGLELVNADSLLVYRGMDIGTAKPSLEDRAAVPHHLIDVRNPDEAFTAGDFVREAEAAIAAIHARKGRAMIIGGTGFYLKALLYGLWATPPSNPTIRARIERSTSRELYDALYKRDEKSALRIGVNDRYRLVRAWEILELSGKSPSELETASPKDPDPRFELLVIDRADEELDSRIKTRTAAMLEEGLVEEVKKIRTAYPGARSLGSVGYAEVCGYLDGRKPDGRNPRPGLEGLIDEINLSTRQLIKRQRTWFRSEKSTHPYTLDKDRCALEKRLEEIYS